MLAGQGRDRFLAVGLSPRIMLIGQDLMGDAGRDQSGERRGGCTRHAQASQSRFTSRLATERARTAHE